MLNRKTLVFLLVIAAMAVPASIMAQEEEGQTIIQGQSTDIVTWNPILSTDNPSNATMDWLFADLLVQDPFTAEPVPGLAESWDISEDGMTYTLHLRDDIFWSDGEPVDAYDVEFTYNAYWSDLVESAATGQLSVESATAIDDYTVVFTFPDASCEGISDFTGSEILPAHKFAPDYTDFMENDFNQGPDISAGAYILEEWAPDDYVHYVPNPTYIPLYEGINSPSNFANYYRRVIPDDDTKNAALIAGEIDYSSFTAEYFDQMSDVEHLNVVEFQRAVVFFFTFNMGDPTNPQPAYDEDGNLIDQGLHPLFGDVNVRRALVQGWDHQAAIDVAIEGHGTRVISVIYPAMRWAYNPALEPLPYDQEAAATLFADAGWADTDGDGVLDKDGVPFSFEFMLEQSGGQWEDIALMAQDNWSELGVEIEIVPMEWGALIERLMSQEADMTIIGFGGDAQPDGMPRALFHSESDVPGEQYNWGSYWDLELDTLMDEGLYLPGCDIAERAAIYYQIQEIMVRDLPADFIYDNTAISGYNTRLSGYNAEAIWASAYNQPSWEMSE